jgi:hypothetical protein
MEIYRRWFYKTIRHLAFTPEHQFYGTGVNANSVEHRYWRQLENQHSCVEILYYATSADVPARPIA